MAADSSADVAADISKPSQQMTVSDADVADDVIIDPTCGPTRPTDPVNGSIRSTRTGQPGQTRPGQRVTGLNRSTRSSQRVKPDLVNGSPGQTGQPDPVNTAQTLATRCHALPHASIFWWRVRARVMEFWGNFGTYRFVLKFPTMWYIDLACLKFL